MEITINWVAVLVAGVVNMAVGWIWYGPLFGRTWRNLMGMNDTNMEGAKKMMMTSLFWGLVFSIVTAYVLAHFSGVLAITGAGAALSLACWIWIGFMVPNTIGSYLWEGRPLKLFILNAVEQFVAIHLMVLVIFYMM